MDLQKAKDIFNKIYTDIDGYAISRNATKKLDYFYVANIYGEVLFDDFYKILKEVNPKENEVFYDLGSGTGKPSIVAYLCYNFKKIRGVEKMYDLCESSKNTLKKLQKGLINELPENKKQIDIDFINNNFNDVDFSDADILFMNSYTYFHYEIHNNIFLNKLNMLRKGARIITTRAPIHSSIFNIRQEGPFRFTWGDECIFIHYKL